MRQGLNRLSDLPTCRICSGIWAALGSQYSLCRSGDSTEDCGSYRVLELRHGEACELGYDDLAFY